MTDETLGLIVVSVLFVFGALIWSMMMSIVIAAILRPDKVDLDGHNFRVDWDSHD